jgi:hypothetical protein
LAGCDCAHCPLLRVITRARRQRALDDPGDGAHVLALDADHRFGQLLDNLARLCRVEYAFDELDPD